VTQSPLADVYAKGWVLVNLEFQVKDCGNFFETFLRNYEFQKESGWNWQDTLNFVVYDPSLVESIGSSSI